MPDPSPAYTLRLRRFDPEPGEAPYWQEFEVALEGHRSVLDGILKLRDEIDGSIGIRCSCRAAICGSCGATSSSGCSRRCRAGPRRGP